MASMALASTTKPIFSDEESTAINTYFCNLIRKQSQNLWSDNYNANYLQLHDLEYLYNFFDNKLRKLKKPYNKNNQDTPYITKLSEFNRLFNNIIQNYNVNILGIKKRNNITINKNNITELKNNNSKIELIKIINSLINDLINKIILNPNYFNQTELKKILTKKKFVFIKDNDLESMLKSIDDKNFFLQRQRLKQHTLSTNLKALQNQNAELFRQFESVFGHKAVSNTTPISLEKQKSQMEELYKKFESVFGHKAVSNTTPISLEKQKSQMEELYKQFESVFGHKAVSNTTQISLENQQSQMKELYEKFKSIFGRSASSNTTSAGGMRKIPNYKSSTHKSTNYKSKKYKTPNYKSSTHKSTNYKSKKYKTSNYKTAKRIKLINKY